MTIVEKVFTLLKKNKRLRLNEMYIQMPEHPPASIRGNINRHIKKESRLFYRCGRSEYALVSELDAIDSNINSKCAVNTECKVLSFNELKSKIMKNKRMPYKVYNKVAGMNDTELEVVETAFEEYKTIDDFLRRNLSIIKGGLDNISNMFNKITHMDAIEFLKMIPDNFVDLVATDPPYRCQSGGSSNKNGAPGGMLKRNDGKRFKYNDIKFEEWLPELYRVMKEGSQGYIMTDFENLISLMNLCKKVGFKIHNLLVWKKNNAGPNRWYMKNCEYTVFIRKGRAKTILHAGTKTVHEVKNILGNKLHPTEKPIELADLYIKNSCVRGGVFLEPFAGLGAFAVSAFLNGMKVLACEIDYNFKRLAQARMINAMRLGYDDRNLLFDLV